MTGQAVKQVIEQKFQKVANLVGNTPMYVFNFKFRGENRTIFAKAEHLNLTGSIKDRMAIQILKDAYQNGDIKAGDTIVEATSGNTGIAFAAIGKAFGHPVKIFMPDWMSFERKAIIKSFGAEEVLVSPEEGGYFVSFEMDDPIAQDALFNYLEATDRGADIFGQNEPLWLRHSTGGKNLAKVKLTSHGFAKRMNQYALEAGISGFHIHRLRHTFAKIVSESVESMADTQEALGHSNIKTTQVYVKRLSVKKDKYSKTIRAAMEQEKSKSA